MNLLTIASLPETLRGAIATINLAPGQTLFAQGDNTFALFVVETGRLQLVRYTSDGKTITFEVARPGESVGEAALLEESYPCTAVAEVPSRIIVYPKDPLRSALRDYPDLAADLMTMLVKKIQGLKVHIEWLNIRAAHKRVLQYLRYLAGADETVIDLDRPLKEIASELGFTPETLSRALARLEQEGIITRNGRSITLQVSAA